MPFAHKAANPTQGMMEKGLVGWPQTYRIQNWRWVRLRTMDHRAKNS
jgi:hypothetical protein